MPVVDRIFAIIIMAFILVFSVIHLGVSIGFIVPHRKYGNLFRPIIGLSSYNLVICILGFLTGILGLVAIIMRSEKFARIVCIISAVLGVFTFASLITALVANSKSSDYVSSHFSSDLIAYKTNAAARDRIDELQSKYQCCGTDMWIDWTRGKLNQNESFIDQTTKPMTTITTTTVTSTTATTTTTTTATETTTTTTTTAAMEPTTAAASATTAIEPTTTVASATTPPATTLPPTARNNEKRDVDHISNSLHVQQALNLRSSSRIRRQASSNYGGIEGLPTSFQVVLPASCCTSAGTLTNVTESLYCVSSNGTTINQFNNYGCAKPIGALASNQFMGFVVINSFLVVLAFVSVPVLLGSPTDYV